MMFALLIAAAATAPDINLAEKMFADTTPNPSAVQFRNVRVAGGAVCGEVNVPNRAGGFQGFRKFAFYSPQRWARFSEGVEIYFRNGDYVADTNSSLSEILAQDYSATGTERRGSALKKHETDTAIGQELLAPCMRAVD